MIVTMGGDPCQTDSLSACSVFGEDDDENKRGFYIQIGILKVKSKFRCLVVYFIGFLIWVRDQFATAFTTYIFIVI